jgi:hypothetical protein
MFSRLRKQFGTAGLIVAVVALIAALVGTAIASGGAGLTKKQEKQVIKLAKKYAGKDGAPGTNGTNGKDGAEGKPGKDGANGKSVELINESPSGCPEGGFTYEIEGSGEENEVCNGEEGPEGVEGSPWTAGGTLPGGRTETGAWATGAPSTAFTPKRVQISFTLPLVAPLSGTGCRTNESGQVASTCKVHFINTAGKEVFETEAAEQIEFTSTACTGTVEAPKATPGNLCIYTAVLGNAGAVDHFITKAGSNETTGASTAGAVFNVFALSTAAKAWGTWAVTAEEE